MGKLFGTDGARGVAGKDLTPELAMQIGRAAAAVLAGKTQHRPRFIIGKDTRISGDMLESALAAGLCSVGADVELLGVIPTPAVAHLVRKYGADAGVVISASHNPVEFNGIKLFGGEGYKLPDEVEEEIEHHVFNNGAELTLCTGTAIGTVRRVDTALSDYVDYLAKAIGADLTGLNIAIDCANGAASEAAGLLFPRLGAACRFIGTDPDGGNINEGCGSTHLDKLAKYVVDNGLDCGVAFDGDADRCLAVDEKGNLVDGDGILYIYGSYMKEREKLANNTIVTTVMSNFGLYKALDALDIRYEKTDVGDKYVYENMRANGHLIGGEQSGHIIFGKYANTGDGILTAIKLMQAMLSKKMPLSKLTQDLKIYPQVLKNVRVQDKERALNDFAVQNAVREVSAKLGDQGRILLRKSGTEPVLRVMVEAPTNELCEENVDAVIAVMRQRGLIVEAKK